MLKLWPILLLAMFVLTPLFSQQDKSKSGVLATLKVGRPDINMKETGERYSITVFDGEMNLPQPQKVLEVGTEFVVVKDFTGLNETRIPLTSIKAVVHFKGFEGK